ncbi:class I adenylate-forming enzyme family protein [Kribbella sp. NPDC051137]|uniref:class I adenylate-forming enzyme family protein n=1 Tax=Kribbella sp. NPDC051137 TaxID=3155045 RepID=UPI003421994F
MGVSMLWVSDSIAGQAPPVPVDQPAVAIGAETPLTWAEFRDREIAYASALQRAGVRPGDRVGMLLKNSVDYMIAIFAIARVGAIAVRLNWRLMPNELKFILNDSGTTLLLLDHDLAGKVADIRADLPVRTYVVRGDATLDWAQPFEDFVAGPLSMEFPELNLDDPACLMYTSGTTGLPKGAIWTHGNNLWFGAIQSLRWKFDSSTVAMTSGPLFHAGGWEALLLSAITSHGTAITYPSGSFDLLEYLAACRTQQVTDILIYSFMVPEFIRRPDCAELIPPTLRRIVCGGDTLMPWVYDEFAKKLPHIELVQVYGLTEGGAITCCLDGKDADRAGSVGRTMPFTDVRIVTGEGKDAPVGEVAELYVRSPAVSPGYWHRDEANAETFVDGWCRTGDLASVDSEGFITLGGRAKDMIRSGGENIYPAEIEAVITTAPGVADAAVVGVPDPRYNEVGCAVLVAMDGQQVDVDAVRAFCVARLAKYKVPKYLVVVDELPRTASGKIKKFELREKYRDLGEPAS